MSYGRMVTMRKFEDKLTGDMGKEHYNENITENCYLRKIFI